MALFSTADRGRIEGVVAEQERRTSGELVVLVVPSSDSYLDVRMAFAALAGLAVGEIVHAMAPALDAAVVLWAVFLGGVAVFALLGIGAVLGRVLPGARTQSAVERRAREEFFARGIFETRDRTGVLLMLSELERTVALWGDAGVHRVLHDEGWQRHVGQIVESVRRDQAADGVVTALEQIGDVLAAHFPPRPDDTNELPDAVQGV
ncbi:MAG: TPM domain-containing protein [Polyangiales bacterium]|nr:TPM domain-containing protein [Myxococcales bacterium]